MKFKNIYDKDYFDGIKSQYGGYYKRDGNESKFVEELLEKFKFKSCLEIGCASGYFIEILNNKGIQADGFDISEYIVKRDNIENIKVGDVLNFPFKNKYDLIFSLDLMEHLDDKRIERCLEQCEKQANKYIVHFISTSLDRDIKDVGLLIGMDKGHINMNTKEWWIKKFKKHIKNWKINIESNYNYVIIDGERFNMTTFILIK